MHRTCRQTHVREHLSIQPPPSSASFFCNSAFICPVVCSKPPTRNHTNTYSKQAYVYLCTPEKTHTGQSITLMHWLENLCHFQVFRNPSKRGELSLTTSVGHKQLFLLYKAGWWALLKESRTLLCSHRVPSALSVAYCVSAWTSMKACDGD